MATDIQRTDISGALRIFAEMDGFAVWVLKAHLLVEQKLNEVLSAAVSHPEHVKVARLRFQQKVELARALSLTEQGNRSWKLIQVLNELRNQVAHDLSAQRGSPAHHRFRELYLAMFPEEGELQDEILFALAAVFIMGFLEACRREGCAATELVQAAERAAAARGKR